jgi:hemoglobin
MNRLHLSMLAAVTGLAMLVARPATAQETLYKRLGGYDAISAVVDDFADRLFADPVVGKRFVGMGADTRALFKQKNKNLVCKVTGGPCLVISRPAKVVHAGMGISETEFQIVVGHLTAVLNKYRVPDREQKELLAIIESLKPDIVESH